MVRRTPLPSRGSRLAAAAVTVALVATFVTASSVSATTGAATSTEGLVPPVARAGTTSVDITSSTLKVVSSSGHRLRVHVLGFRTSTGVQVAVDVQTRNEAEEHEWLFKAPDSGVSVSAKGKGRIHLTSKRSAGYAIVSLKTTPQGSFSRSTCHGKTATRTRHVSLSGTLLFRTRSHGTHAWGKVGSLRHRVHFSAKSKVTWQKPASADCSPPPVPCRNTFMWIASGGPPGEFDYFSSANKGAHAEIAGLRSVSLAKPSGASRSDIVSLPQPTPNQLIVNPDQSATMQATFRGGTATMTSPQPPLTTVERCGKGTKVSIEQWSAPLVNGATPIRVPAQIFGAFSTADTPTAAFGRITLKH
jgi:hypothetical protein